jgi:hypothetical protein
MGVTRPKGANVDAIRCDQMSALDASAATLGGAVGGIVIGLLARADMRVVALIRHQAPELSVFGSVGVVFTFGVMALGLATAYVWWQRGRPSDVEARRAAWWSLAGLALFTAVILLTPLRQELAAPAELLLFIPMALLLGAVPAWLSGAFRRALPDPRTPTLRIVYRALGAPAILASIVLPLMLLGGVLQVLGVIPVPAN